MCFGVGEIVGSGRWGIKKLGITGISSGKRSLGLFLSPYHGPLRQTPLDNASGTTRMGIAS